MSNKKFSYAFEEGDGKNKMLLGGKGANLAEMTQIGLNVPPGFTISTEGCLAYLENNRFPDGLMDEVKSHMQALEKKTGKGFGSATNPLLVSVRSGSAMSMPGMMDTILNLGLNPQTLDGPHQADRKSPLRLRRLPALHPALRQDRARRAGREVRRSDGRIEEEERRRVGRGSRRRAAQGSVRNLRRNRQEPHRQAVPR